MATAGAGRPLRVLVIEDEPDDAELVVLELRRAGFDPAWTRVDGAEEYLRSLDGTLDVVIADYHLPQFCAPEALRLLHERGLDVPFIVVTARVGEEAAVECMRRGAADYLLKDRLSRLGLAVERALTAREAQRRAGAERAALVREQAAREAAEAANRAKDQFLAMVSHELRGPLQAILGWARLVRSGRLDPGAVLAAMESIGRNAQAQLRLIEDLLDISRIVAGKFRIELEKVNLGAVVEEAVESIRPVAAAKRIEVRTAYHPGGAWITGDAARLKQVAWNLLANAVKFTPAGGSIDVRLERAADRARLTVADTGEGIAPEALSRIFERFEQAGSAAVPGYEGLGLGLAIVRHIVELHRGTVHAESDGRGRGASFVVSLPLAPGAQAGAEPLPADVRRRPVRLDGVRVLVVDDEDEVRTLLATALAKCGAEVAVAASAAEARESLEAAQPDVLVSDIRMPEEDGHDLIRSVRALELTGRRRVPALALTAAAGVQERVRALSAGFDAYTAKPLDPDEFVELVAELAARGWRHIA